MDKNIFEKIWESFKAAWDRLGEVDIKEELESAKAIAGFNGGSELNESLERVEELNANCGTHRTSPGTARSELSKYKVSGGAPKTTKKAGTSRKVDATERVEEGKDR